MMPANLQKNVDFRQNRCAIDKNIYFCYVRKNFYFMKEQEIEPKQSLWQAKRGTMAIIVAVFLVLGTVFTFVQEFRYEARSRVLLIQNFPAGVDPYNASKSNEFLANVLAHIIKTNTFYQEVLNAGFNINREYFGEGEDRQLKAWQGAVSVDVVNDSGILDIRVYHPERAQADQISRAVNFVLRSKHQEYHGMGEDIGLRVIDQPLTSRRTAKPNVPLNLGLSLLFGLAAALMYVYLFPDDREFLAQGRPQPEKVAYTKPSDEIEELQLPVHDPAKSREHLSHRQVEYYQSLGATAPDALSAVIAPDDLDLDESLYTRQAEIRQMSRQELKKKADIRNVLGGG
jgi:capsular polysaccharide biosynthesis protein